LGEIKHEKQKQEESMFTEYEKKSRHNAIRQILDTHGLKALLLIGDKNTGHGVYGDLRYYTNNVTVYNRQIVVVFIDSEPVLIAGGDLSRKAAIRRSFVGDCRTSYNYLEDLTKLLKERGVSKGRIGVSFEMLPVAWYRYLEQGFPDVEWVEIHEPIMQMRLQRSQEEADAFRKGAALADGEFETAVRFIRPGVSEYEIVAEIEHYGRARGVEEHFTLIGSGKFATGEANNMYAPSHRRIETGDTITMEITPRYEGYWTQLNRTVNVGKPNEDVKKMQKVCFDAIKKGLEKLKPGLTPRDIYVAVESYLGACGYVLNPPGVKEGIPLGHIFGVDLADDRIAPNDLVLTPGTAVTIHPLVSDGKKFVTWGETYLVTQDGYERLNRVVDEVLTL
jgi:Xaa-Pro aminopeptidase